MTDFEKWVKMQKMLEEILGSNLTEWQYSMYGDKIFLVDKVTSEILEEIEIHMGLCIEQVDYYEWNGRKFKDLDKVKKFIEESLKGKK